MMTETETETTKDETPQKPGTLLRQKRESLGLTQKQVADKLRLRVTVIESLEDNNFNIDKVSTFVRGYIRSYARIVGLDEQSVVKAYDQYCGSEQQELSMTSFSRKTARQQHNSRINLITFGIIVIVIGISSLWWYQNQKDDTLLPQTDYSQSDTTPSSAPENNSPTLSSEPQPQDEFNTVKTLSSQDSEEETESSDTGSADTVETQISASEPAAQKTPAVKETSVADTKVEHNESTPDSQVANENDKAVEKQPAAGLTRLSMDFKDDCWVRVKDANGKTLIVGLKKAGRTIQLQGQAPFSFILGAPESVSVTFAGEPVDLSRYTSGKVARFTLP
ncbi:cytoskeleton protein RodZ [Vibrio quintilis]|uniref:Cytoskeleton protein RodZ n=1 Tax=Vibrio quintilis TaxID=1117707 RepID=A0A1M7YZS5_9VIBR|nr:cytoskeleton protein RodZ [Vibrio quintilis]SHO58094.1 Cytoskeleton protein RodZ [Vibrio quintilis]